MVYHNNAISDRFGWTLTPVRHQKTAFFFVDDIDGIVFEFKNWDHEDLRLWGWSSKKWNLLIEYFCWLNIIQKHTVCNNCKNTKIDFWQDHQWFDDKLFFQYPLSLSKSIVRERQVVQVMSDMTIFDCIGWNYGKRIIFENFGGRSLTT